MAAAELAAVERQEREVKAAKKKAALAQENIDDMTKGNTDLEDAMRKVVRAIDNESMRATFKKFDLDGNQNLDKVGASSS